jgi:3-deoxy-manno-octulosonate cytidylyltransferase (CMP-KDO synthetase)
VHQTAELILSYSYEYWAFIVKQVIVIPARMGGTRLPGKPLIKLNGIPMIKHVWNRCTKVFSEESIFVATEDQEIIDYCNSESINCVLTEKAESAIDRIKLFSETVRADTYINVQGDEPLVNIKDISTIANYASKFNERVVFGRVKANFQEFNDFSKAKVVCDLSGKLLYSSRAGIPVNSTGNFVTAERAIWIYAFSKSALNRYFEFKSETKLDKIEDNEIIRFLEIGEPVYCVDVIGDSWAVDEFKDIQIVEERLKKATGGIS